jgi:hypothetical protein
VIRRPQPRTIEVSLDVIECEACGRSLLRGERSTVFVDTDMMRRRVCDLCPERAARAGWLPEDAQRFVALEPDAEERGGLLSRLRRRAAAAPPAPPGAEPIRAARLSRRAEEPSAVDRALDVFNASEFPGVIAGIARSLGRPTVTVAPRGKRGGVVSIVVAWRLAWFRYEVHPQLGVQLVGHGDRLSDLAPHERSPNAAADADGCLRAEALAA